MRNFLRYLLPLTILVVASLLGVGGRAQAGYVSLASLANPSAGMFSTPGLGQANPDEMGAAAAESDADVDRPADGKDHQSFLYAVPPTRLNAGASSTGAGSQSPPSGSGAGGSSQPPATLPRPETDALTLVGVLFLETTGSRPPPFPSRLFRPPRLS